MIDRETVEQINDSAKILDVVSDYVTLRRRGANYSGLCPFHNEKTPSFNVNPARNIFKCFGCGKGGDAAHFLMEIEHYSYPDALRALAKKYHIEIKEREQTPEELAAQSDRESMLIINEFANKYFQDILNKHTDGRAVGLSYFRERGFRDDTIAKFQLGYSLDEWDALLQAAEKAGYKREYLLKTGLCSESDNGKITDRFRGRVMFPIHSLSGRVIGFGGRVLKKDEKTAKYVNSPESEIYHKSNELYGIFFAKSAIVKRDMCYLVEGYTDVISMHQSGIENVVASSGTSLTEGQIRLIHRFTENVTIIYDGDSAGIKASLRGIDMFLAEGLNIKVLLLPDGEDPDSFARNNDSAYLNDFIERNSVDFIRFKTKLLLDEANGDPVKRAALTGDIVRSIAAIPNQLIRAEYVKECSTLLNISEDVIYNEINKLKKKEREKLAERKFITEKNIQDSESADNKTSTLSGNKTVFEQQEYEILSLLFRNGKDILYNDENKQITVENYIIDELEDDKIEFRNSLYNNILKEYIKHKDEADFSAERYFKNHSDSAVSNIAVDLFEDKYKISKIFRKTNLKFQKDSEIKENFANLEKTAKTLKEIEKQRIDEQARLTERAQRIVFEYKNSIVLENLRNELLILQKNNNNMEKADSIMNKMLQPTENKKKIFAKELGERVLIKL